jgi:hypothetical protein
MKADDVRIGGVYVVKVSGSLSPVRIDSMQDGPRNKYRGTNLWSGRTIGPFTSSKCRREIPAERVQAIVARRGVGGAQ